MARFFIDFLSNKFCLIKKTNLRRKTNKAIHNEYLNTQTIGSLNHTALAPYIVLTKPVNILNYLLCLGKQWPYTTEPKHQDLLNTHFSLENKWRSPKVKDLCNLVEKLLFDNIRRVVSIKNIANKTNSCRFEIRILIGNCDEI